MCRLSLLFVLCLLVQVTGVLLTLLTRSLCVLINAVINSDIKRFYITFFLCNRGGGGMMNFVSGSLFSSYMAFLVLL